MNSRFSGRNSGGGGGGGNASVYSYPINCNGSQTLFTITHGLGRIGMPWDLVLEGSGNYSQLVPVSFPNANSIAVDLSSLGPDGYANGLEYTLTIVG